MTTTEELSTSADGRTARRNRNRLAVLDAVIQLFSEEIEPSPEEVAVRSGLSPRSVYRYFEDRDALLRAAIARQLELLYPLQLVPALGEGTREERIERLVSARLRLYLAVADTARAARHRARRNDTLAEQVRASHLALREQVATQFAEEFVALAPRTRRAVLLAVDAQLQFESLDYFFVIQQLTSNDVQELLVDSLRHLFGNDSERSAVHGT